MNEVIETNNLTKYFGPVLAVDQINLRVQPGEIYGFLGLNGAVKTTAIRMILGMIHPNSGSVQIFGGPIGPHGKGPWERVGHLVERPSTYPELTVRENLEVARRLHGIADKYASDRVIERLKIESYADRKAGKLSTGNMQRLGVARALLHEPDLLILDEPVSGLDPAGVVEIRELLAGLARDQGVTIFMSSHILGEVDRLASPIGIIHEGKLLQELDRDALIKLRSEHLAVCTQDLNAAQAVLIQDGYHVEIIGKNLHIKGVGAVNAPEKVATILVEAGHPPTHISIEQVDLENLFLRLIGGGNA